MKAHTFREQLLKAKAEGVLVSVFANQNRPSHYIPGWVEAVTDEHILLRRVSESGFYNGFALRRLPQVFRIDRGGRNEEAFAYLYQVREQHHRAEFVGTLPADGDLLSAALLAAQSHQFVVTVVGGNTSFTGWLKSVDSEAVVVEILDDYGESDGESILSFESIAALNVDDQAQQDLKLMAQRHSSRPPDWLEL